MGTKDANGLQSFTKKHTRAPRRNSNSSENSMKQKGVIFSSQEDNESIESPFMNSNKKSNHKNYNNLF